MSTTMNNVLNAGLNKRNSEEFVVLNIQTWVLFGTQHTRDQCLCLFHQLRCVMYRIFYLV